MCASLPDKEKPRSVRRYEALEVLMFRFSIAVAVAAAGVSASKPANAADIGLTHRECTKLLADVYAVPDLLTDLYKRTYQPLEKETQRPTEERRQLTEKAWDLKNTHRSDWIAFAKEVRAYCDGLK